MNLYGFVMRTMPVGTDIQQINYCSADILAIPDPDAPKREKEYLKALDTFPRLRIHNGQFLVSRPMYLDETLTFSPKATLSQNPPPRFARVVKMEEKGTDVNSGVHLA